jgi:Tfp pilus assembly protein PilO
MSTITIANRDIPVLYLAIAMPVLVSLYVGYTAFMADGGLMSHYNVIVAKEAEVDSKRGQAAELRRRTQQIDVIKHEVETLQQSITLLKSKIPPDAHVGVLLYDLERLAKASKTSMDSFTPGDLGPFSGLAGLSQTPVAAPTPAASTAPSKPGADTVTLEPVTVNISELPIKVEATSTFPQLIKFLDEINSYERKLNVSNLSLAPAGGAGAPAGGAGFSNALKVSFTIKAYVLKTSGGTP